MFFIVVFVCIFYVCAIYGFLKQETRRIIHGLDMSIRDDAVYYSRRKTADITYNKNNKLHKKIIDLIFTYFVAFLPLLGGILLLFLN